MKPQLRPRIGTVLFGVNLVILLLPLLGIQALSLYESELIRQTEAALVAQGSYVREHYLAEALAALKVHDGTPAGTPPAPDSYGIPVLPRFEPDPVVKDEAYDPITADLDLARTDIRPPAEESLDLKVPGDPVALAAGSRLSELLRGAQRYTLSGVRVVDFQGIVVASSRGEIGQSLLHREEVMRALTGEYVSLLRRRESDEPPPVLESISRGGRVRVFVAMPVLHGRQVLGAVVLSRTPLDIQKALYMNRYVLLRYSAGLILIVLFVSALTAKTISRPIAALIEQTERVRDGKEAPPIDHPGSKEVAQLSGAVDEMARTLKERAAYIETFARNVSHEFKTPLATFQGTVELLKDHVETMTKAERERFLGMLAGDARRMERLVTRLLHLARAETINPGEDRVELAPALARITNRFRELGLNVEGPAGVASDLVLRMADETFDALVSNLLDNARQHGGPKVRVTLALSETEHAGLPAIRLDVRDDGPGISAANLARVFDAFFTTAREAGGTGLGLAIVRATATAHGGTALLASDGEGKGAVASLVLPRA